MIGAAGGDHIHPVVLRPFCANGMMCLPREFVFVEMAAVGADVAVAQKHCCWSAGFQVKRLMLGTPLVPMMLLTVITDCWPVTALCSRRGTPPPSPPPAHLFRRVMQHHLFQ